MADMKLTWTLNLGGVSRTQTKTVTATDPVNTNAGPIVIANGASDTVISLAGVDQSQLRGMWVESDQDVLVEFNSNAGSGGSLSLKANVPYIWITNWLDTVKLTADLTAVYVTNASGASANLYFYFLHDATP